MDYPGRWLILSSYLLWAGCAVLTVAWLVVPSLSMCDLAPGSSIFGEETRSWLPPGTTCTWTDLRGDVTHVDPPPYERLGVVAMAALGPFVSRRLEHLLRDREPVAG